MNSPSRVDVVLDVNVLLKGLEAAGSPGRTPTPSEFLRTTAGFFFATAARGRRWQGHQVRLVFSKHVLEVFGHVAEHQGICPRRVAVPWLANLIAEMPLEAWAIDAQREDYQALSRRARQLDGVLDAMGRPDVEDEAVLRLCAAFGAVLVTFENDDNLPAAARRRGIRTVAAREVQRELRCGLIAA